MSVRRAIRCPQQMTRRQVRSGHLVRVETGNEGWSRDWWHRSRQVAVKGSKGHYGITLRLH